MRHTATAADAENLFCYNEQHRFIICRPCGVAVWPDLIDSHLYGTHHNMTRDASLLLGAQVKRRHPNAIQSEEWQPISHTQHRIPELPKFPGWRCLLSTSAGSLCTQVASTMDSMRKHLTKEHNYTVYGKSGGSGVTKEAIVKSRTDESCKKVFYHKLFALGKGKSLVEILDPGEDLAVDNADAASDAWSAAQVKMQEVLVEQSRFVRPGQQDEISPWLRRTQWAEYLQGFAWQQLHVLSQDPHQIGKEDQTQRSRTQLAEEMQVWLGFEGLLRHAQRTVAKTGVLLRCEIARSDSTASTKPLVEYQDEQSIEKNGDRWIQLMMVLVRRCSTGLDGPNIRLNTAQTDSLQRMMRCARVEAGKSASATADGVVSKQLTDLQSACLQFAIEMLNQVVHAAEYDMGLVCASAVLGADVLGERWKSATFYTTVLSSIIKVARFLVVEYAVHVSGGSESESDQYSTCESAVLLENKYETPTKQMMVQPRYDYGGPDSGYASSPVRIPETPMVTKSSKPSHAYATLKRLVDAFMIRGTGSPMNWFLDLRAYGMKIMSNSTLDGFVTWRDNDEKIEYKSIRFTMSQFREMVKYNVDRCRDSLLEVLECNNISELPDIAWETLGDNARDDTPGWSFLQDSGNGDLLEVGKTWLIQRIRRTTPLRNKYFGHTGWRRDGVDKLMRNVRTFLTELMASIHLTAGQPARGTEILSVRHRNTVLGEHRNLFIEDGWVVYVTKYHKGYQVTGDVKLIHRYLPREVGRLVVWYLWLALPFVECVEIAVNGKTGLSSHLWPNYGDQEQWHTANLREQLQNTSNSKWGCSMGVADYRQLAVAISRKKLKPSLQFGDETDEDSEGLDLGDFVDLQAAHSPAVAGLCYGRTSMEATGAVPERRAKYRLVSEAWHRFLGMSKGKPVVIEQCEKKREMAVDEIESSARESKKAKTEDTDNLAAVVAGNEQAAHRRQVKRFVDMRAFDALASLKQMMQHCGKEVTGFQSVQAEAMEKIKMGDSPVVAVLPTGAGKSVLFLLPCWQVRGGVTVVVVPLVALKQDMCNRIEQLGLRCKEWNEGDTAFGGDILLVTPEAAVKGTFDAALNELRRAHRLDRIVIDEAHVVAGAANKFRPALRKLGSLMKHDCQVVLLTATLPPDLEPLLCERMFWSHDQVHWIRGSTTRKNIEYEVKQAIGNKEQRLAVLLGLVQRVMMKTGKVLIMCEIPEVAEWVAKSLECEAYHGSTATKARSRILQEYRSGVIRMVAATGAFGLGIDIPDIRLVVNWDNPRNILEYAQCSGRGGRDGLPTKAVIMTGGKTWDDTDTTMSLYMKDTCRRITLASLLDGVKRGACGDDEVSCDVCKLKAEEAEYGIEEMEVAVKPPVAFTKQHTTREHWDGRSTSQQRAPEIPDTQSAEMLVEQQMKTYRQNARRQASENKTTKQHIEDVKQRLRKWKGQCGFCAANGQSERLHNPMKCPTYYHLIDEYDAKYKTVHLDMDINRKSWGNCFTCKTPQDLCENTNHEFRGVAISTILAIKLATPKKWDHMVQELVDPKLLADIHDDEERATIVWKWMGWAEDRTRARAPINEAFFFLTDTLID